MMTIDTTEMKNAIKTSTAFQDFGIKRMTVEGFKIYRETEDSVSYQVAIRHKVLDNEDNASVYQVTKHKDGQMYAYFNGTFRVAKDGTLESCWDVHYGGFTNEMAREWLSALFNGDDPARQDEVEEELSEAPDEPETVEEEVTMKDVDKAVHEAEDTSDSISDSMDWMAKDFSKLEATILATGDKKLIWYFNRCVRRTNRVKARAGKVSDMMNDISFFTREESYKSA